MLPDAGHRCLPLCFVGLPLGLGSWALCLLALQLLFGRQVEALQTVQLGRNLALNVRLTELSLERYPPHLVSELTGLQLAVVNKPSSQPHRRRLLLSRPMRCSRSSAVAWPIARWSLRTEAARMCGWN